MKREIQKTLDSFRSFGQSSSNNDGSYLANDHSRPDNMSSFSKNDHSSLKDEIRSNDLAHIDNGMVTGSFGNRLPLRWDQFSQQRITIVIDYNLALPDITGILRKYQHLLHF